MIALVAIDSRPESQSDCLLHRVHLRHLSAMAGKSENSTSAASRPENLEAAEEFIKSLQLGSELKDTAFGP